MVTRMLAYLTLGLYLVTGTVAVRLIAPKNLTLSFSTSYFDHFKPSSLKGDTAELIIPKIEFAEIKFPVDKPKAVLVKVAAVKAPLTIVSKHELNFREPVILDKIKAQYQLLTDVVAFYRPAPSAILADIPQTKPEVDLKVDEVSTKLAAAIDAPVETIEEDLSFFEYPVDEAAPAVKEDLVASAAPEVVEEVVPQVIHKDISPREPAPKQAEEVVVDDLIAFDYSSAKQDIANNVVPTVSKVTTHKPATVQNQVVSGQEAVRPLKPNPAPVPNPVVQPDKTKKLKTYQAQLTIQITGSDLKRNTNLNGFEVRFQDDQGEAVEDFGHGSVVINEVMAHPQMTRSATILKRGFVPTSTDLILEEGVSEVSIPMIEEDLFNEEIQSFESNGPVGALLVELDEKAEYAKIDAQYGKMIKLDADLKAIDGEDFTYQLFVGIKAGNILVSYKNFNGEVASKIVHIHEREVTFEANYFENLGTQTFKLTEEDLLAREQSPLIISEEQVKQFATGKSAVKVNDHTFKMDFGTSVLATRQYLELNHQSEPVFIGMKNRGSISVPSESFMRFILSNIEGKNMTNRCVIQVNLEKKASHFEVGSESVGQSLMVTSQVLDKDGKFYDSISDKSRKIIVVGELQNSEHLNSDGKVNLKITYQDKSVQFVNSYCSANTYLVEQL